MQETQTEALVGYVADRDVPCPACGYNLRGLTSERCPECAEALRLTVGLAEPRVGLLVAGTVGLAAGAGFSVLVGLWGMFMGAGFDVLMPLAVGAAGGIGGAYWWVTRRAWVRHRPPTERAALVAGCWGFSLVVAIWFFARVG